MIYSFSSRNQNWVNMTLAGYCPRNPTHITLSLKQDARSHQHHKILKITIGENIFSWWVIKTQGNEISVRIVVPAPPLLFYGFLADYHEIVGIYNTFFIRIGKYTRLFIEFVLFLLFIGIIPVEFQ